MLAHPLRRRLPVIKIQVRGYHKSLQDSTYCAVVDYCGEHASPRTVALSTARDDRKRARVRECARCKVRTLQRAIQF